MVMTVPENHAHQMQSSVQRFWETLMNIEGINFPAVDYPQKEEEQENNQKAEEKKGNYEIPDFLRGKNQKSSQSSPKNEDTPPKNKPTEYPIPEFLQTRNPNQNEISENKENSQENNLIPQIEIWQNRELIKGKSANGKEIEALNPILDAKLEIAHQLAQPGDQIEGLENIEVIGVSGKTAITLFKTDEQGKVEINRRNFSLREQQTQENCLLKAQKNRPEQNLNSNPDIITQLIHDYEVFRTEIKAEIKQEMQEAFKEILKERMKKPQDVNWWQKASKGTEKIWDLWRSRKEEQSAAHTVLQLWQKEANRGDKLYQANGYSVYREGNEFKLKDNKGNELLRFRTNSIGATFVTQSNLTQKDLGALKDLQKSLKTGQLTEDFITVDKLAASREIRTLNIVKQLVSLPRQTGSKSRKESDENNKYLIRAAANGEVTIFKKDENNQPKIIFQRNAQGRVNLLTKQDMDHLENVLRVRTQSAQELERQIEQVRHTSSTVKRGRGR